MDGMEPSALSLLPAVVTIALAFATRQVIPALLAGVLTGSVVVLLLGGSGAEANPITRFFFPAIGSRGYAQILLIYLWCLGGLIGIWGKTGGARHFAEVIGRRVARDRRTSLLFAWVLGCVFHQGGTVSTVLTGTTVKPVTDRHDVSHEELAYVVDSTASPIATVLPFNAWPAYVGTLVAGTIPLLPDEPAAVTFFLGSIPYNFYGIFAVVGTLLFSLGLLPWIGGAMSKARDRAMGGHGLDAPDAEPLLPPDEDAIRRVESYTPSIADFALPIGILLTVAVVPFVVFDSGWANEAFALCLLSAMGLALARGMPLREVIDGFLSGCRNMTIGAIVLGLAVTLGAVSRELGTAAYVVATFADAITPVALPALLAALCMAIAFATGTSWGTYAVVFPVALPLAWALSPDPTYVHLCFGAVLGGAVFGDQCSPISDTTILSSMFTGCDLMHHVRTQLPLALSAAGVAALLATAIAVTI